MIFREFSDLFSFLSDTVVFLLFFFFLFFLKNKSHFVIFFAFRFEQTFVQWLSCSFETVSIARRVSCWTKIFCFVVSRPISCRFFENNFRFFLLEFGFRFYCHLFFIVILVRLCSANRWFGTQEFFKNELVNKQRAATRQFCHKLRKHHTHLEHNICSKQNSFTTNIPII